MSATEEALKIWNALKPMVNRQIEDKTRSCVRAKKMSVTTAPSGGLVGVTEPFCDEIFVPYSSALSDLKVGDAVWVWYFFNNASTMIVLSRGNGQIEDGSSDEGGGDTPPEPQPGSASATVADFSLTSEWTNFGGAIISGPTTAQQTLSFDVSGVPSGATVSSAVFSATFGSPYTGIDALTVNGSSVSFGSQSVSLTPLSGGNGTYTVNLSFRANGDATLSDGQHSSSITVTSARVTVSYTA